ncbi:Replication termination factor 2 [Saguinus oedipus]|uniref:Replication termination factor 2 n=1 Tax=Saguinus oedipus TaxID=9490 RepID=A0ABQ9VMT8_SAGOE|nr:Replication termination factor 2 [Saguinus oedipus]
MGCDGGTIPKRHELVKGPKKVEKVSDMGGQLGTGGGGNLTPRNERSMGKSGAVYAVKEKARIERSGTWNMIYVKMSFEGRGGSHVDKDAELVAQWNYCTLSQEILRRPIVACELGRLYNKDAVIEFLLDKSAEKALGKAASHIKSIKMISNMEQPQRGLIHQHGEKNVTELKLSDNPAWEGDKGNTKGDKHDDLQRARFICPVVGLEMNGRHRLVTDMGQTMWQAGEIMLVLLAVVP